MNQRIRILGIAAAVLSVTRGLTAQGLRGLSLTVAPTHDTVATDDSVFVELRIENHASTWVRAIVPFTANAHHVLIYVLDENRESAVARTDNWSSAESPPHLDYRFETTIPGNGFVGWRVLVGTARAGPGHYRIVAGMMVGAPWAREVRALGDSAVLVVRERSP